MHHLYLLTSIVAPTVRPDKTNLCHVFHSNPKILLFLEMTNMILHHIDNIIVRGIYRRGLSRATWRRYMRQVFTKNVLSPIFPENTVGTIKVNIIFYEEDALCINPHDNDHMVITIQHGNWDIKNALIDLGSLVDILFWDFFQKLQLNLDDLQRFANSLIGLYNERVKMTRYVTLKTTLLPSWHRR